MPAYRRQQPLSERISAALNIYDWLLWLSEEIESYGWDQVEKTWALPIGFISNLIFIIARSNTGTKSRSYNDVFGESSGPGWAVAIANFFTYLLTIICVLNTAYTFARKRSYRLFEASVDKVPNTPSAHRVKVHSAPMSSSPLRYISSILGGETAASRAHPNPQEDVWEVMLWDPLPVSLKLFCYFSPGHVILYWLFLPTLPADPRPSVTVVTALLLAGVLSLQLTWMSSCFSQQGKDTALISKEVMNEYDVKFVRPRTTPLYRDVGIQFSEDESYSTARDMKYNEVVVFPPAFVINRGFKTNPNPNYTDQADQGDPVRHSNYQNAGTPADIRSPVMRNDFSSPLKPQTAIRQPVFRPTAAGGGSLGVYSHAASPLRKSASTNFTPGRNRDSMSPEKRRSVPGGGLVNTNAASQRWSHLKNDPSRRGTATAFMDKPPRRCFSEHGVSSRAKTSSLVPSHIATKIREAQLRQTNTKQLLLGNEKDKPTAFYLGTDRSLRSLNFSLKLPKTLPSWRITQIPTKQQVDGAENLPSIDTVIAEPSRVADKTRNMAETEFYEHTDNDGVVRRRSMMRTVNKDDCLTGRGANPRTGLITPDVCSVAGSIDSIIEPRQEVKLPSAQWKLKDNQWVSEIQDDEDKEIDADHQLPRISETNTQPLTSTNLRSFSHSVLGEHSKHKLQSPSTEAILDVGKIRRKPIGSPSKVSSNSSEAYKQRSVSEGTVIRTPSAVHSNPSSEQVTSFFSPDDVERVRGLNGPRKLLRNQYDRLPFLDLPAKPYQSTNIQGFAKGKKNLMQLERSLRMNDGPYPFPPSNPQINTDRGVTHQIAFLPAAPRTYFSDLTGQHNTRHPAQQRHPEQNRSLKQEKSVFTSQSDLIEKQQIRHENWESQKKNLNTSALNSMKLCYQRDTDQTRDDQFLSRQDTSLEDVHNIPNGRLDMPRASKRNHGDTSPIRSTVRCRPPLGPRSNETNNPTFFRSKRTHMEQKDRSNLTGTPVTLDGEDIIDRSDAGNTTNLPHPTSSTGTDIPVNLRNPTEQRLMAPEADPHDHSSCCPRCCVEYNCHEGCLGHSPQSEVDKSETSSLLSMGVFEASFETSIKSINDVLLTPEDKRGSVLTKLRQAFLESLWQNTRSPTRESTKQPPLKRTLRHPSPIRGGPIISGPLPMSPGSRHLNAKQAKAAARKAMDYNSDAANQPPKGPRPAKVNCNPVKSRKPSTDVGNVSVKNGANERRKVSTATTAAIFTQEDVVPDLEEEVEGLIDQVANDVEDKSDAAESVIAKIGALVPYDRISKPLLAFQPTILKYGPALLLKSKDMVIVILDTLTILSCVICDYKRTGYVTLPDDVNVSEFMGNCLRSILYLMIAVCLYAFLVKVSRIVLCILRIVLLPVRLCAWVIG